MVEFGLLAAKVPFGLRYLHTLSGPPPNEVSEVRCGQFVQPGSELDELGSETLILSCQVDVGRLPNGLGGWDISRNSLRYARRYRRWWTVPQRGVNSYLLFFRKSQGQQPEPVILTENPVCLPRRSTAATGLNGYLLGLLSGDYVLVTTSKTVLDVGLCWRRLVGH